MPLNLRFTSALLIALACLSNARSLTAQQPEGKDWMAAGNAWWSHVEVLADDKLQGRRTGTPGYEAAVDYVIAQFTAMGLKAAGTEGFRQPAQVVPTGVDNTASSFQLGETKFSLPSDVSLSPRIDAANTKVDAPVYFMGYGLHVPRKHVDDLAGIDLHGKVVALYNAAPANLQGPQRAYARGASERWKALQAAGAIGMIMLTPPRPGAPPNPAAARNGEAPPQLVFTDPLLNPPDGPRISATLTPAGFAKLLQGSGHTAGEIKSLADAGKPLPRFALTGTLQAHTALTPGTPIKVSNVVGELEGSDRKLRKQYVVISAHLDHLGVGRAVDGDTVYNGAMDNASGVASVIEAAKLLSAGPRPKRSILFVAFFGEELGELGSQYFATKPPVPKHDVVADLNMDMYLPLFPLRFLEVQGLGESTLGNDARAICQLDDVEVQFDKQPDENRFVRSDQVNFVKQGIPALAFKFGWTPDSPEEKTFNEWVKVRYHKPSDDLQQPIDKAAAAQFTSLLAQLATRVANAATAPSWYPESTFSAH